jgi:hypothetical protein
VRLESEIYVDSAPADRRNHVRDGVDVLARAHLFERRPVTVNIRDLTTGGFLMEAPVDVAAGTPLYLQLPGMPLTAACVIWSSSQYLGCQFTTPLSVAELGCIEDSAWRI